MSNYQVTLHVQMRQYDCQSPKQFFSVFGSCAIFADLMKVSQSSSNTKLIFALKNYSSLLNLKNSQILASFAILAKTRIQTNVIFVFKFLLNLRSSCQALDKKSKKLGCRKIEKKKRQLKALKEEELQRGLQISVTLENGFFMLPFFALISSTLN